MSNKENHLIGSGEVWAQIATRSQKEPNMELLSYRRRADLQGQTTNTLASVWLDSQKGTLGQGKFSLKGDWEATSVVRLGTQTEEERTRRSEDRGRELLGVMEDHPCERAMNSEKETAKTMTAVF